MPANLLSIYQSINGLVAQCEQRATTIQRRTVDDASRRLVTLYSQLTYSTLSEPVIGKLSTIAQMLRNPNPQQKGNVLGIIQDLTTAHFGETGGWVLGLRRLCEMGME